MQPTARPARTRDPADQPLLCGRGWSSLQRRCRRL